MSGIPSPGKQPSCGPIQIVSSGSGSGITRKKIMDAMPTSLALSLLQRYRRNAVEGKAL